MKRRYLRLLFLFMMPLAHIYAQNQGDTLMTFNAGILTPTPDRALMGVEFAEGYFWVTGADPDDTYQHKLYKISADGQTLVDYYTYPFGFASWKDMCYDGEFLYVADIDTIRQIDLRDGQPTGVKIPGPIYYQSGLAYDPATDHFWVSGDGNLIYEINRQGNVVRTISFLNDLPAAGLAWDVWTEGGPYLWIWSMKYTASDVRPLAYQMFAETGLLTGAAFEGVNMNPMGDLGADYALGATISDELIDGKVTFIGLQGSSYQQNNDQLDWVVSYDLAPESSGLPGPVIAVSPPFIQNNLMPGDSTEIALLVANLSDQFALDWYAALEYPNMPDSANMPGDTLLSKNVSSLTPANDNRISGIAFLNNRIFLTGRTPLNNRTLLYEFSKNLDTLYEVDTLFGSFSSWQAISADENSLYAITQYTITQFDPIGDTVLNVFYNPGITGSSLAYNPQAETFFLGNELGVINEIDKQGNELNFYQIPYPIEGLSWDSWSPGGPYLWASYLSDPDSTISFIRINPGSGNFTGVSFQGTTTGNDDLLGNVFVTPDWQQNKLVLLALQDDGEDDHMVVYDLATTPPPGWISLKNPSYGSAAPLSNDTLFVKLFAIMEDTLMNAQIIINSNDVVNPRFVVPVNFLMLPQNVTAINKVNAFALYGTKLYPVPVSDRIQLSFNAGHNDLVVRIYDLNGRLMLSRNIEALANYSQLDVSRLPAGVYHLKIAGNNGIESHKFVKTN